MSILDYGRQLPNIVTCMCQLCMFYVLSISITELDLEMKMEKIMTYHDYRMKSNAQAINICTEADHRCALP